MGIFDGNVDVLGQHPVQTFELRSLLQRPRLVGPVLGYVFPEIERQMRTDAPMFLLLDDAAVTWLTPQQGASDQQDIRREAGAALSGLAHDDAPRRTSAWAFRRTVSVRCSVVPSGRCSKRAVRSRFFLPMTAALEPNIADIYRRLGLTDNALRTIATSRPQRDVYYMCKELGQRTFSLPLGPLRAGLSGEQYGRGSLRSWMRCWPRKGPKGLRRGGSIYHGFHEEARYVEARAG